MTAEAKQHMKPNISEFSYGFALTNELVQAFGPELRAAPIFPSLIAEGQSGGGWDVMLDRPGAPLFLQFKLSDCMTRRTCRETRDAGFNVPCYRMSLRRAPSRQHEMLLELESSGRDVYYVAPGFHEPQELNEAFRGRLIRLRSLWVRPSQIGPLPDEFSHHVSFEQVGAWQFFSKPRSLEGERDFEAVALEVGRALRTRNMPLRDELRVLAQQIAAIAESRTDISGFEHRETVAVLADEPPLRQISHFASMFLDSQLFIVQSREA